MIDIIFTQGLYWWPIVCGVGFGYLLRGFVETHRQVKRWAKGVPYV